jgi:hypothetical protein
MLLAVSFILWSSSLPTNQPAKPTANSKIISSIIQASHAHAACLFLQNFTATRKSSPTPLEVSPMAFVNPATAAGIGRDDCRSLKNQNCLACFGLLAFLTSLGGGSRAIAVLCVVYWYMK